MNIEVMHAITTFIWKHTKLQTSTMKKKIITFAQYDIYLSPQQNTLEKKTEQKKRFLASNYATVNYGSAIM